MNQVLSEILASKQVKTSAGQTIPIHSHISAGEGQLLQQMVAQARPDRSIEIGMAYGISSLYICEELSKISGARHTVIDPFQDTQWQSVGLNNLERAGYRDMIRFIQAPSYQALPKLQADGETFQFAFIDGAHTFDYAFIDLFYIDLMLDVGGIVVFDDIGMPSVRKICRYVLTNLAYEVAGPNVAESSGNKKLTSRVLNSLPQSTKLFRPEALQLDSDLGISNENYIALRKTRTNFIEDGKPGSRRWDDHVQF